MSTTNVHTNLVSVIVLLPVGKAVILLGFAVAIQGVHAAVFGEIPAQRGVYVRHDGNVADPVAVQRRLIFWLWHIT